MEAEQWISKIKDACKEVGTYQSSFDIPISTLADILQKRDETEQQFKDEGRKYILEHTNAAGATNTEQNPLIRLINDLNRDALTYFRDLGLTPKGLKAINEKAMKAGKESAVEKLLDVLGG